MPDYPTPTSSPDRQNENTELWSRATSTRSPQIPGFNELTSFALLRGSDDASPQRRFKRPRTMVPGAKLSAAWYLDSVGSRGTDMPIPTDLLWADIATFNVTIDEARLVIDRHLDTTHSWLPVVSKIRLKRLLSGAPALCEAADFAALIVAMDLLAGSHVIGRATADRTAAEKHDEGEDDTNVGPNDTYQSLKAVLAACEQKGLFSTNFLAAQVLTAAHETAQGLYPASYFTVGACVRLCHTFGLHNRRYATQLQSRVDTWNETEERRRLWWASIALDRLVSVGFLFRPLAVPSIPPNEIIPGEDHTWDEGNISASPVLIMSIESQASVSPFARTCQAAHLLGRVCDHVNEHIDPTDVDFHFQEATAIQRAGEALLEMIRDELRSSSVPKYKLFSAMALSCSGLLSIYGTHSCIEIDPIESSGRNRGARLEMQRAAIDGYQRVAGIIAEFASDVREAPTDVVSPFVLQCLYEAGCSFAWIYRENGSETQLASLQQIRALLRMLEARWAVAGELCLPGLRGCDNASEATQ